MVLDEKWFGYVPPSPETQPKYDAIRAHRPEIKALVDAIFTAGDGDPKAFEKVNAVCFAFAKTIDALAPESADKITALRAVRHARALFNRAIVSRSRTRGQASHPEAVDYVKRALQVADDAEQWAEAAIALQR